MERSGRRQQATKYGHLPRPALPTEAARLCKLSGCSHVLGAKAWAGLALPTKTAGVLELLKQLFGCCTSNKSARKNSPSKAVENSFSDNETHV